MNAIILAAGKGTRLRPLTNDRPKPLVTVNGQPIIERQIEYLREIGIENIIVVTGYMHEKFDYFKKKYGVKLIYNEKYDEYNNGYTMYLVRDYLKNSYVLEGDVYLTSNILLPNMETSAYFSGIKENFFGEWVLTFNDEDKIIDINIGDGTDYIMTGVSYWNNDDGSKINNLFDEMLHQEGFEELFWDELVKNNLEDFNIKIQRIKSEDWFEIDSVKDHETAEKFNAN